jgi:MFS transporter, ACDE family, multidrug resistance protein
MNMSAIQLGWVFFAWGLLVAVFAVFGAPALRGWFGTPRTLYVNLVLMAADLTLIGVFADEPGVVAGAVIAAGAFIGVNNTLVTTAVMSIAPVPRPVASATYGFVRFIGGGLAPYAAGKLVEHFNAHVPFVLGAVSVVAGAVLLGTVHGPLTEADQATA